jgi:hypothetical protein
MVEARMSEALSSIEIEDVLSSIRRLVSEDLRPAPQPKAKPAGVVAPVPVAVQPLILTPSLRVVPPAADVSGDWDDEADALVAAEPMEWAETDEEVPAPLVVPPAAMAHRFTLTEPPRAQDLDALEEEVDLGFAPDVLILMPRAAADRVAEPEPQIAAEPAAVVPSPAEAEVDTAPWAQEVGEEASDDLAEPELAHALDVPDGDWADQAAAEVIAGLEDDASAKVTEAVMSDLSGEITYDEELLRDLVRDLIREELSGALGEKITRNVRKLVRAEIAQALATRDLD